MSLTWHLFPAFASVSVLLWSLGAAAAWKSKVTHAGIFTGLGLIVFLAYIILMWTALDRPPLRTMGETRLWYSLFLPLAGLVIYSRQHYKWILSFSTLMALMFICINLFKPEIHTKALMPALQSPWFAPHVIVYMFAYAVFGASFIVALIPERHLPLAKKLKTCDTLVEIGFAFMTFGMLMGAIWAKEAWGHYWGWDPKETWAAVTWFSYLSYIHIRRTGKHGRQAVWILLVSFVFLQMCWWGINYLPSAQGASVHTYNMK